MYKAKLKWVGKCYLLLNLAACSSLQATLPTYQVDQKRGTVQPTAAPPPPTFAGKQTTSTCYTLGKVLGACALGVATLLNPTMAQAPAITAPQDIVAFSPLEDLAPVEVRNDWTQEAVATEIFTVLKDEEANARALWWDEEGRLDLSERRRLESLGDTIEDNLWAIIGTGVGVLVLGCTCWCWCCRGSSGGANNNGAADGQTGGEEEEGAMVKLALGVAISSFGLPAPLILHRKELSVPCGYIFAIFPGCSAILSCQLCCKHCGCCGCCVYSCLIKDDKKKSGLGPQNFELDTVELSVRSASTTVGDLKSV